VTRHSLLILWALTVALVVGAGSTSRADDLNRPTWWNFSDPNNSYQLWEFSTESQSPLPDGGWNTQGYLAAQVLPNPSLEVPWQDSYANAQGVWNLVAPGVVRVPVNDAIPTNQQKVLWIQMTWLPIGDVATPQVGATVSGSGYTIGPATEVLSLRQTLRTGWNYSVYQMTITPSPAAETLLIGGNIFLDELVVDTHNTVPEPATAGLLLVGFASILRRRR
jgi:hypothetical protein